MTNINPGDTTAATDAAERLRRHPLFADIPQDVLGDVVSGAFEERRDAGDYFFREGDPARHCLLMVHGRVDMVRVGIEGQERVARFFEAGELVAEAAMFMAHGR